MVGDINHIIVIESLKDERLTGTEIYFDCIKRYVEYTQSTITHKLFSVDTKEKFLNVIKFYEMNSPYMIGGILIHIEMHGDEDLNGFILGNGTLLTWEELANSLRPINIITCNKLYVSVATCNGRYLYKGVDPYMNSPYSCYISASTEVCAAEIVEQFTLLFDRLISNGNLITAYLDMEKEGTSFYYKDSEEMFKEAFALTNNDPETRQGLLESLRALHRKKGIEMPPDYCFDDLMQQVFIDEYNTQKKHLTFPIALKSNKNIG